ncbi:MAG: DNA polymerase III subunit alpha [Acholeplasmatales bacterium]|nr:MAG: DNA polymerase III subunit alpha [Acholeplasmatales bacterium]
MVTASLYLETAYSFNGSNIRLEPLLKKALAAGCEALALTDRKMHLAYQFHRAVAQANLVPLLGLQLRLESLFGGVPLETVVYARSTAGYQNLLRLSSLQSYNTVLTLDLYEKYGEDTTLVLMMHDGELSTQRTSEHGFKTIVQTFKSRFPHTYLGVHPDFPCLYESALPKVPIDYVNTLEADDGDLSEVLRHILNQPDTDPLAGIDTAFKGSGPATWTDEDRQQVAQFVAAHQFTLDLPTPKLPAYPTPSGVDARTYLQALAEKGLTKRLSTKDADLSRYRTRLKRELDTIHRLGYDDYFLMVWDIVKWARSEDMLVGPGRGSAPGSLVAYALGITYADPLEFDLLFERFLNDARATMPDIDIDFPDHARDRVIDYARKRFGEAHVSQICTFGTFLKKSALRDTGRVFEIDSARITEIAKRLENYDTVFDMAERDVEVANRMHQDARIARWLSVASRIEGLPKHVSTHAAGVVITHEPITEYTAIQEGLNDHHQTQYAMEDLEAMGLLKMDFLGLRNLTMIEDILEYVKKEDGQTLNLYQLPLDDAATFKLLREGSTTGLFQLESAGMRQLIRDMQIQSFDDIVVVLALYRPGPMQSIKTYLARRHKQDSRLDMPEEIRHLLAPTEGILLYQEQIMAIASEFAGYTLNEADLLRRAVSKKSDAILQAERSRFIDKAVRNGKDGKRADALYDYIVTFANYGFNKSHSVAYGMIAYWMAYLKAHYPAYFIAVLMQSALGSASAMKDYTREAMQLGIEVKGPDVQHSGRRFVFKAKTLHYPLLGIRNIGTTVVRQIESARQGGPFRDFIDFVTRTHTFLNKRSYQYLIYSGACDSFGLNRHTMLENVESIQHYITYQGQGSASEFVYAEKAPFSEAQNRQYELEALGFTLSHDPLKPFAALIKEHAMWTASTIHEAPRNRRIYVAGVIKKIRRIRTKKDQPMAFLTLEDRLEQLDVVCFPETYAKLEAILELETVIGLAGKVTVKDERLQLMAESGKRLTQAAE